MSSALQPSLRRSPTLDEEVQVITLDSGLRVFYCPKPGFKKRYACYSTLFGSVDSTFRRAGGSQLSVPDGIAHFLEHALFETEKGNVSDLFSMNGAHNNAMTSFTTTTYLFACTQRFYENLDLLLSFVENPVFDPAKVEKEKGIIEEEIHGYDDSPGWVGYMGLLSNLFATHPIRIDIAGTVETVRSIDSGLLHECYRTFYHPANMALFVVGDLDATELFEFVAGASRPQSEMDAASWSVERLYGDEPQRVAQRETRKHMEVAVPKLFVGFKDSVAPDRGEAFIRNDFVTDLGLELLFGNSSDLYRELYEAELILDDFGSAYSCGAGIGYAVLEGDTPDPDRLRSTLLERIASARETGFDDEAFERGKRRFMGSYIRGFNSLEFIAAQYTYSQFYGYDLFGSIDVLAGIEKEEVEARLRELLDPENYSSFVVLPKSD